MMPAVTMVSSFAGGLRHRRDFFDAQRLQVLQLVFVLFQRMPGDEESENFFFGLKARVLVPVGDIGQFVVARRCFFLLEDAKQAVLAGFGVALGFLRLLHGLVEHGHELSAAAEGIHGAALDQRFDHALVEQSQVDVFAELEDGFEAAQLLARGNNRFNGIAADILHRGQAEADGLSMWREVRVGDIDIGRLDGNAHLAAFVDVLDDVVGRAGDRRQQRRHEFDRIVRLQIGRVIGEQGVGGGVRLVEAVSGELRHQVENLLDLLRRILSLQRRLRRSARAAAPSLRPSSCPWRGGAGRRRPASIRRCRFAICITCS